MIKLILDDKTKETVQWIKDNINLKIVPMINVSGR